MADTLSGGESRGVRSHAAIFGHPLHPMVVPFPIAFLAGVLIADLIFLTNGNPFWATASYWLLMGALITGLVAAVLGFIDFARIRRVRSGWIGWVHMGGNAVVLVLSAINLASRAADPIGAVPDMVVISALVVAILLVTGWLGGELVFRHKVGVIEQSRGAP